MKHAEIIAERLWYLSDGKATPATKPDPIKVGKALKEMIAQDVEDEKKAIDMYSKQSKCPMRKPTGRQPFSSTRF